MAASIPSSPVPFWGKVGVTESQQVRSESVIVAASVLMAHGPRTLAASPHAVPVPIEGNQPLWLCLGLDRTQRERSLVCRGIRGGSSKSGQSLRFGHSQRAAHSSQVRTSALCLIRAARYRVVDTLQLRVHDAAETFLS